MLKTLFDFQDASKLVKSFLSLSLDELLILAQDPMGSYAVEAFLKSRSVTSENKHMLTEKFKVMVKNHEYHSDETTSSI